MYRSNAVSRSEARGFTDVERREDGIVDSGSGPRTAERGHRLVQSFGRQPKRAEVHADGAASADVQMRLHRLLRIHVNVLHEPARFICADRYQRKIDPRKTPADLQEMRTVPAVASEVDPLLVYRDHEAAP